MQTSNHNNKQLVRLIMGCCREFGGDRTLRQEFTLLVYGVILLPSYS